MDVACKSVLVSEKPESFQYPFSGIIRGNLNSGAEKQPLNIVPSVKLYCKSCQLIRFKGCPGEIVGSAVHAILTVVHALVCKKHFE